MMMRTVVATLVTVLSGSAACRESKVHADVSPRLASVGRPTDCRVVVPGEVVQRVIDKPGVTAVCLEPGTHVGAIRIDHPMTLWGPREAVIHAQRPGSTIVVTGTGATLLGFTIDGSGGRFDQADAAILVASAKDIRIEGISIVHAVFGVSVEQSERVQLLRSSIHGSRDPAIGQRGDTVRLWETRDSRVEANTIADGRDILIWYSRGNAIINNHVEGGRYGFHFMYSHDSSVTGNEVINAVVGVFAMYSRGVEIRGNVIGGASGAAGMGIGLKESGNIDVIHNRLIRNTSGIYIDLSPLQPNDHVRIERNELRLNDRALVFHSSGHRVQIVDNDLIDNDTQTQVDGGGDALGVSWRGNHFDDYEGYDLDDDGIGDVPYELRSLSNQLTSSSPNLALFRGTLALGLVDAASHLDPLYQPKLVLVDSEPRTKPRWSLPQAARTP